MLPRLALLAAVLGLFPGCAGRWISFPSADLEPRLDLSAELYRPAGSPPFPAVVLLHGCHGVLPTTHAWARWLQDRGYIALVVDSWRPRNIASGLRRGCLADEPDLPPRERFADAIGALAYLQARGDVDPARVGVMGWSNGGAYALRVIAAERLARARRLGIAVPELTFRAAVAFYPGGCGPSTRDRPTAPLLVLIGGADDWTPAGPCEAMGRAMAERGADVSVVVYPGAYHYFDVEGQAKAELPHVGNDHRPGGEGATVAYDPAADTDARVRVAGFLTRHLGPR